MSSEASPAIWTAAPPKRGALAFASLFAIESFARALVATVVSVQAHDLLMSSQKVSVLFTCVSLAVLVSTLSLPILFRHVPRRWIYTIGVIGLILASLAFALHTLPGQVGGMYLRNVGTATLNISLSLYILDHIRKADLVRSEPMRLTFSATSWTIGPFLGVWLYQTYGAWAPQALSIASSILLLAFFWYLRLNAHPVIKAATSPPQNPVVNVGRFVSQPRLRLAWFIAFGRSCFWSTFFIYGSLLMIEGGLGKEASGILISASQIVLGTAFLFGKISERTGVRKVISLSFAVAAVAVFGAGYAGTSAPVLAGVFLLIGAVANSALDGVGGIPYLRSVRAHERPQMTGVYRSYIDLSDLLPSFIYSIVLLFFPLGTVFYILGILLTVVGIVSWRYLPRSM
ncbi:MFS transporter [Nordella sp. HKS 07]|uniref:MFS transporter n=1 Tax=Nordella sp. HKS 07 TaxID=2712222 RepID=UPI0013E1EF07|nr:MFS transporter [Nordella sp. HKS 07]QIG51284.1 MFS transporter [Nordella sp. HKS 07]